MQSIGQIKVALKLDRGAVMEIVQVEPFPDRVNWLIAQCTQHEANSRVDGVCRQGEAGRALANFKVEAIARLQQPGAAVEATGNIPVRHDGERITVLGLVTVDQRNGEFAVEIRMTRRVDLVVVA